MWNFESLEGDEQEAMEREARAKKIRAAEEEKKNRRIHFVRFDASIQSINEDSTKGIMLPARLFLHDFAPLSVKVFSTEFLSNNRVELKVFGDRPMVIEGRVIWCERVALNTRIITRYRYAYRAEVVFAFKSTGRKEQVQDISNELLQKYGGPGASRIWGAAA